jgi:hypothetical protein
MTLDYQGSSMVETSLRHQPEGQRPARLKNNSDVFVGILNTRTLYVSKFTEGFAVVQAVVRVDAPRSPSGNWVSPNGF